MIAATSGLCCISPNLHPVPLWDIFELASDTYFQQCHCVSFQNKRHHLCIESDTPESAPPCDTERWCLAWPYLRSMKTVKSKSVWVYNHLSSTALLPLVNNDIMGFTAVQSHHKYFCIQGTESVCLDIPLCTRLSHWSSDKCCSLLPIWLHRGWCVHSQSRVFLSLLSRTTVLEIYQRLLLCGIVLYHLVKSCTFLTMGSAPVCWTQAAITINLVHTGGAKGTRRGLALINICQRRRARGKKWLPLE